MNAKNGRRNTDFQLAYFLAGSCHTPDGAYALLCELREEREEAIAAAHEAGKISACERVLLDDEAKRERPGSQMLRIDAEVSRLAREDRQRERLILAAEAELRTINALIERVQPHRLYAHLPDAEAHEMAQPEEWRLELIARAENAMLGEGRVPADLIAAMRQHPAWADDLRARLVLIMEGGALMPPSAAGLGSASPLPALLGLDQR